MEAAERDMTTLLYVEDDAAVRERVATELSLHYPSLKVLTAENGALGLESYREKRPDLVVTDINMPLMNGIRMSEEIKALDAGAVIVAVTAYNDAEYLMKAIEVGITSYLL